MTEQQIERGRAKLNELDHRRPYAYKNQIIALRDDVRRITGMGVRDFRRFLREHDA